MTIRGYILVDVDGTVNTFHVVDHYIIRQMFENNKLVILCDKLLWHINALDIISNSMKILKLRILLYSILSFSSFRKNFNQYGKLYLKASVDELRENYENYLLRLEEMGYRVRLITHNEFTRVLAREFPIRVLRNKPRYFYTIRDTNDIAYMIGNNYIDDLRVPMKLGIPTIYIGKGKVVSSLMKKRGKTFSSIMEAVSYILQNTT